MRLIQKVRFSMGTIMMFVLMAAAGMALFVKIQHLTDSVAAPGVLPPGWNLDIPSLFLLAIVLTSMALGSWKEHSAVQIMLQVTLACVGCLTLIWIGEAKYERAIRYWCQGTFAATVTLPMLGRRFVKSGLPRGSQWRLVEEDVRGGFLLVLDHDPCERRGPAPGGRLHGGIFTSDRQYAGDSAGASVAARCPSRGAEHVARQTSVEPRARDRMTVPGSCATQPKSPGPCP